jgi:hypothetical protein
MADKFERVRGSRDVEGYLTRREELAKFEASRFKEFLKPEYDELFRQTSDGRSRVDW